MKQKFFALSLGFAALTLGAGQAGAAERLQCAKRDAVVALLATKYSETRHSLGLAADSAVMEVFASKETGTWTIIVTLASGVTCIVAAGQSFEVVTEAPLKPGQPA